MARYAVRVREILARTIIVEGVDSYEEAVKCVWETIGGGISWSWYCLL